VTPSPRKLSLSLQLSDPVEYEGCVLELHAANSIEAAPLERGTVIAFPSYILHRVSPILSGRRRSLVAWFSGPCCVDRRFLRHGQARLAYEPVAGRLCRPPGICAWPLLFRHFIEQVQGLTGSVYGRGMYDVMRYWDEDRPEWSAEFSRLRGGVAAPAQVGGVALAHVGRPQRHARQGMTWKP